MRVCANADDVHASVCEERANADDVRASVCEEHANADDVRASAGEERANADDVQVYVRSMRMRMMCVRVLECMIKSMHGLECMSRAGAWT